MATPAPAIRAVGPATQPPPESDADEPSSTPEQADDANPELAKWGVAASQYISGMCMGIYSSGGIGKTTLAATAADSEWGGPVQLLNAGANPHVLRSMGEKVIVTDIVKFTDIEATRQKILRAQKNYPFKTIVLDVVSEMHAMALRDRYGPTTDIEWTMHSAATAELKQMIRNFRDLATHPNFRLNVIFSLWATPEKRKVRGVEYDIMDVELTGKLQASFPGLIPFLGYLYIPVAHQAKGLRVLDFRPLQNMQVSKFGMDPRDENMKNIPHEIWNPSLASIIDTMHGLPWPIEKHAAPKAIPTTETGKK